MLIPLHEIRIVFEKISKKSLDGGTSVVIFCSYEVDSLCATRILTGLLKSEGIIYKVIPVSGYTNLRKQVEKLKENRELRSIVFINNGGKFDLTSCWFAEEETKVRAYVFDYHRPINHCNVNSQKKIIVIDDGHFNIEECPLDEEAAVGIDDDDELDDLDDDKDDIGDQIEREYDEEGEDMEIQIEKEKDGEEGEDEIIDFGKKRKERARVKRAAEKRIKLEKIYKTQSYYRGDYFGKSIAGIMYFVAQQLNKENLDYLWYWIIGITDQLIHNRVSFNQYETHISDCRNEVLRLSAFHDNMNSGIEEEEEELEQEIMMRSEVPQPKKVKLETINKKIGTIIIERDLRLFLLRNWTLYDSMYYSNYMAAKLSIWKEKGRKELNRLITKIGVPLNEAQQQYRYMNNNLKKKLKDKILDVIEQPEYNLSDILIHSFLRQIDTKTQISASDLTYALSSILEAPKDLESAEEILEALINKSQTTNRSEESKSQNSNQENFFLPEEVEYNRIKNFWYAYEALAGDVQKLDQGIELAIEMQKKTMTEAIFLLEKRGVQACKEFRYCLVKSESTQEKFFSHPLTLQKLAILMLTFLKELVKKDAEKPFLVYVHHKKMKKYLVVGVSPFGDHFISNTEDRNEFGNKFAEVARKTEARVLDDNFESSIIEIPEDDFEAFFGELQDLAEES